MCGGQDGALLDDGARAQEATVANADIQPKDTGVCVTVEVTVTDRLSQNAGHWL